MSGSLARTCRSGSVCLVAKPLDLPFDPIERAAGIWADRFGPADAMAAVTSIMRAQQILLTGLVLLAFSRTGALPLRVIGERLMVHPTSVTNTVDRLERDGLVRRRPNPRDGRGTLAEITPSGRDVVTRSTADLMAARFGMAGYDTPELGELFTLLRGLRISAGDFRPEPVTPAGDGG